MATRQKRRNRLAIERIPVEGSSGVLFVTHRPKAERMLRNNNVERTAGGLRVIPSRGGWKLPKDRRDFYHDIDRFKFSIATSVMFDTFDMNLKREFMAAHKMEHDWA